MNDSEILLAKPRGFCAGVDRAIAIVERALELHGAPIYVRHEIVHNKFVVDDLRSKGAVFVEELDEVPRGATVIFSAHGVALDVRREAESPRSRSQRWWGQPPWPVLSNRRRHHHPRPVPRSVTPRRISRCQGPPDTGCSAILSSSRQ